MRTVSLLTAVALCAAASPAAAAGKPKKNYDPNRLICQSRGVIGSRLQRVRECHTAQEWEDLRMQERVGLMRKQYNGAPGPRG
ncbi:MAG TPA: hypothetical protein VHM92_09330 [Allosphingosinicella sp.]|nr:hypothetical protein [Allosphingosinicella sp.]